jgi:hypothetical protein
LQDATALVTAAPWLDEDDDWEVALSWLVWGPLCDPVALEVTTIAAPPPAASSAAASAAPGLRLRAKGTITKPAIRIRRRL